MNNQEKNNYVKNQLLKTLLQMLNEMPFDKIVISDLVSKAEVGRSSFYRNYNCIEDILINESNRLINEWGGKFNLENPDGNSKVLESLLNFLKEHDTFYKALYNANKMDILQKTILSLFPNNNDLPNVFAYLYSSIAYTIYGWIHEWIKRGMQETGTEIAQMIEQSQK